MPYYFLPVNDAVRKFAFGRQPSRTLLAQSYFELYAGDMLQGPCGEGVTYEEVSAYLLGLTNRLTIEDIEHVYKLDCADNRGHEPLDKLLKGRGLDRFPRSRQELQEQGTVFLDQRYKRFRSLGVRAVQ